eukprot:366044-Chlamydomonas_euryale.AAC.10
MLRRGWRAAAAGAGERCCGCCRGAAVRGRRVCKAATISVAESNACARCWIRGLRRAYLGSAHACGGLNDVAASGVRSGHMLCAPAGGGGRALDADRFKWGMGRKVAYAQRPRRRRGRRH